MPSELRPTEPSDGPQLAALAQRLLGVAPDSPMFSQQHMRWKYWSTPNVGHGPRGYVLVRDGAIVAHAGVLPLRCRGRDQLLTLLHPFDWMSEPSAVGSGAALLSRLGKLADGLLIVGGSDTTRRMVRPLGFRALDDVRRYAAPGAASAPHLNCHVHPLTPEALPGAVPDAPAPWLRFERAPEWLRACLACPAAPMALFSVTRGERRLGEFLLAFAPGQTRLAALWPASNAAADWSALARAARQHASLRDGRAEIACMANESGQIEALEAAGFQDAGRVPMFVLAQRSALADHDRLAFQMVDSDFAFLHNGRAEAWLPQRHT